MIAGVRNRELQAMRVRAFGVLSMALLLASPVHAQRQKSLIPDTDDSSRRGEIARAAQEKAGKRFAEADADKDGRLSREEVGAHFHYMAENFERHDKNGDGVLSWQEFVGHDRWERPKY
jgi:Ca2+-binding EF-hand superfamily protein